MVDVGCIGDTTVVEPGNQFRVVCRRGRWPRNHHGRIRGIFTFSHLRDVQERPAGDVYDVTTLAEWTSSDPAVATVTFGGVISARTPGTVLITASYLGISG